jgi:predicted metal-binding protein
LTEKEYIVVVQCHIVKERCSGFLCEHAFNERKDCFSDYAGKENLRYLSITCGGCCGRGTLRKLQNLITQLKKKENISKDKIVVHLSSCAAFESSHGPECPHKDYLANLITEKAGLDLVYGSRLSAKAEARRKAGVYKSR